MASVASGDSMLVGHHQAYSSHVVSSRDSVVVVVADVAAWIVCFERLASYDAECDFVFESSWRMWLKIRDWEMSRTSFELVY